MISLNLRLKVFDKILDKYKNKGANVPLIFYGNADACITFAMKQFVSELFDNDRRVFSDNHPDLTIFKQKQGVNSTETVEHIITECYKMPFESKFRVIMIDDFQLFNITVTNKLLKVLEEPPELTKIIIGIDDINNLLDTIKSRCLLLNIPDLTIKQKKEILEEKGLTDIEERILYSKKFSSSFSIDYQYFKSKVDKVKELVEKTKTDYSAILELKELDWNESLQSLYRNNYRVLQILRRGSSFANLLSVIKEINSGISLS